MKRNVKRRRMMAESMTRTNGTVGRAIAEVEVFENGEAAAVDRRVYNKKATAAEASCSSIAGGGGSSNPVVGSSISASGLDGLEVGLNSLFGQVSKFLQMRMALMSRQQSDLAHGIATGRPVAPPSVAAVSASTIFTDQQPAAAASVVNLTGGIDWDVEIDGDYM